MGIPSDPGAARWFPAAAGAGRTIELAWTPDGLRPADPRRGGPLAVVREGPSTRLLRARTTSGAPFLLEVPLDRPNEKEFGGMAGRPVNPVLEDRWARLARAGGGGAAPGSVPPEAMSLWSARYHPLLHCSEKGVSFHVPCPGCGSMGTLEDCRDDVALASVGQPRWAESTHRYLWCQRCSGASRRPRLYSPASVLSREETGLVEPRESLYRDLAELVARGPGGAPPETVERWACLSCDRLAECYPPAQKGRPGPVGQAAARLEPVSFLPFAAVARPDSEVDFGEQADILAGAPWQQFRAQNGRRWTARAQRSRRESMESALFTRVRAVDPLRALGAKLELFEAAAQAVLDYQRRHAQPHLGVSPRTLECATAHAEPGGRHVVDLLDPLAAASLASATGDPAAPRFFLPPPSLAAPFAHRDLLEVPAIPGRTPPPGAPAGPPAFHGTPVRVAVEPGRMWAGQQPGSYDLEVDLRGEGFDPGRVHPADRVLLRMEGRGWENALFWCRTDSESQAGQGAGRFRVEGARLLPTQYRDMQGGRAGPPLAAMAVPCRGYGAFYDVHALGVLLLYAMLANAENPFEHVASLVLPALESAGAAPPSAPGPAAWDEAVRRVQSLAQAPALRDLLGPHNASFLPSEYRERTGGLPPRAWAELLATVAACVTRTPGFSFSPWDRLEETPDRLLAPAGMLLATVRRIRTSLPSGDEDATVFRKGAPFPAFPGAAPAPAFPFGAPPSGAPAAAGGFTFSDAPPPPPATATTGPFPSAAPTGAPAYAPPPAPAPAGGRSGTVDPAVQKLAAEVREKQARIERLESELKTLRKQSASEDDMATRPFEAPMDIASLGAGEAWKDLMDAFLDTTAHGFKAPKSGSADVELARTVLTEGLDSLNAIRTAVAELGGGDFAEEQRDLRRMLRKALVPSAGKPPDPRKVEEAQAAIRKAARSVGKALAVLAEAHSRSVEVGARQLLLTLEVMVVRELGLKSSQEAQFKELVARMKTRLPDLVGQLFDKAFQDLIRSRMKE